MRSFLAVLVGVALWPGVALAQSSQIVEYYHTDALGSVRVVTKVVNNQVQVVETHDFMPFGEEVNAPSPEWLKRLFTGTERDFETGLDHLPFRQLATEQGRFTTPDRLGLLPAPSGDGQDFNLYAYVRHNPLRFVDPSGLQATRPPTPGLPVYRSGVIGQFSFDPYDFTLTGRDLELFLSSGFIQTGDLFPLLIEFIGEPQQRQGTRASVTARRLPNCNDANNNRSRFFEQLPSLKAVAKELNVPAPFIVGLSSYESGWLDNHNFALNNMWGLTNAGGNNLSFPSIAAGNAAFVNVVSPYVQNAHTVSAFFDGLKKEGWNSNPNYFSIDPQKGMLFNRISNIGKWAQACGASF